MKVMNIEGDLDLRDVLIEWFSTKRDKSIADRMHNLNRIFSIKPTNETYKDIKARGECAGNLYGTGLAVNYVDFQKAQFHGERSVDGVDPCDDNKYCRVALCDSSMCSVWLDINEDNLKILKGHPYIREVADIFASTKKLDNLSLENIRAFLKNQEKLYDGDDDILLGIRIPRRT